MPSIVASKTIVADPEGETAIPIMVRCAWGPGTQSRHVLVIMKPSVSRQGIMLHMCQSSGISTTRSVITELVVMWML